MAAGRKGILRFDLAAVAVYDPVAMNRNATRNMLYALGFREIESYAALDDLRRAMTSRDFDLVVAEASKQDDPVFAMIARIRRSEAGRNPFAIVIASTWMPEGQLVGKALDAGADDLLCRPFSTSQLNDRLRTHVLARKSFVVTSDYVGPDRRGPNSTRDYSVPLMDVVNSLHLKAVEGMTGFSAQGVIESAIVQGRTKINTERMRRLAFQIGIIASFVESQARDMNEGGVRRAEKIIAVAREIQTLAKSESDEQPLKTSETIIDVASKAAAGNDIAVNAKILVRLSVALQVTLSPELSESVCRSELEDTLERVKTRLRA